MALTPEDVVNKRFQSTKFREGYDQDEVDDFLDEVVVELRRLTAENEELRAGVSTEAGSAPRCRSRRSRQGSRGRSGARRRSRRCRRCGDGARTDR
ncbi:DivIVA domain-containing protein [Cryobacterium breve]|uniref:Cell wall synthesis protein Wag31 n=1 Tax=Cryobacterium breve TaxID=1259258 RepID=A0ABY7NCD1_9MICO|nr:DivIVA domain-containing protein [Cryobacterium breve]